MEQEAVRGSGVESGERSLGGFDEELARLSSATREVLARHGFDGRRLAALRLDPESGRVRRIENVTLPREGDVVDLPEPGTPEYEECRRVGERALREGRCALAVLAGGMATRMGGVVKALVDVAPGKTFLDLRLAERASLGERYGVAPPLWLLTSHGTRKPIREHLGARLDGYGIATFDQRVSLRLREDGSLYLDPEGQPSLYATGHGDFPEALVESGLLERFLARGGEYVLMSNVDNLGGGLDPVVIGAHLRGASPITCEVVDKWAGDRGGIPVRVDETKVVLEEFLLPPSFDPNAVRVFNSNTLAFSAARLAELGRTLEGRLSFFPVRKEVGGERVLQFERLVHELTFSAETTFLRVPRSGQGSRFLPVKNHEDLEANREALLALAAGRGMLRDAP